jgi:serine/threonine protein kinase
MSGSTGTPYRLRNRLGAGSFGEIYLADHFETGEEVAVKFEPAYAQYPQLLTEFRAYKLLAGAVGIPTVRSYGVEGDFNVMIMEYLGSSLEDLFVRCNRRFSLKTTIMIADQLIARIQYLHSKNLLHRDVKPDNFLIGIGDNANTLYVIDLGLSRRYRDHKTSQHIPNRNGKGLMGTARYSSLNTHLGFEQSRRDDLESLAYVLIYFLKGYLPWMGLNIENQKAKQAAIGEKKLVIPVDVICAGLPPEFANFLNATRRLEFTDTPEYEVYRRWFRDLLIREGEAYDYVFDWNIRPRSVPSVPIFLAGGGERSVIRPLQSGSHTNPSSPALLLTPLVHPAIVPVGMADGQITPGRRIKVPNTGMSPRLLAAHRALRP